MALRDYLPSKTRLSQEVIATTVGVLVAAWIVSKVPRFKALVDANSVWRVSQSEN